MTPQRAMAMLIVVTAALPPGAASAEEAPCESGDTDERRHELARASFGEGQRLVEGHDFEEAVAAFRCSFQNAPHAATMYNIARAAELAGQMRVALDAWRSYLAMSPEAEDRPQVERHVAALEASLAAPASSPEPVAPIQMPAPVASPFDTPLPATPPPPAPAYPAPPPAPSAANPAPVTAPGPVVAPGPLPPPPPSRPLHAGRRLRVSGWSTFGVFYGIAVLGSLVAWGMETSDPWYLLIPVAGPAVLGHVAFGSETYGVVLMWIWTLAQAAGVTMLAVGYARGIAAARVAEDRHRPAWALLPGGPGGTPGLTLAGAFF